MTVHDHEQYVSLEDYAQDWFSSHNDPTWASMPYDEAMNQTVHFSGDLTEATYNLPFQVLDENLTIFDQAMKDFRPWQVFRDLWASHEREVDLTSLKSKGYWDGPDRVTSKRGTFMGDGLSFLHLTLFLGAKVRAAASQIGITRPLGQAVGDDLLLMEVQAKFALAYCRLAEALGCKFSKLNSLSQDSFTFCENYGCTVEDLSCHDNTESNASLFGDVVFLDCIKGSCLSGKSKVKVAGSHPFIGQASMVGRQLQYHPVKVVKERAKCFLWCRNYMSAVKLGSSMTYLPRALGGLELPVGKLTSFDDEDFRANMLPWYERMLLLPLSEFLKFYVLLKGVFQQSPKGKSWSNEFSLINDIVKDIRIYNDTEVEERLPDWVRTKSWSEKLRFITKELRLISFFQLTSELTRQESFLSQWNLENVNSSQITLVCKQGRERANKAWARIKSELEPVPPDAFQSTSMNDLAGRFMGKTVGFYVSRDADSVRRAFEGMPSLYFTLKPKVI